MKTAFTILVLTSLGSVAFGAPATADTPAPAVPAAPPAAAVTATTAPTRDLSFALGYDLECSKLRSMELIGSVKELQNAKSDVDGADMVTKLTEHGELMRRLEAESLRRAAKLIHQMNGPAKSEDWATKTAEKLGHPIDYTPGKMDSKEKQLTDKLSAMIDDISHVQNEMLGDLGTLIPALQSAYGVEATWSFDIGSYAAMVRVWDGSPDDIAMLQSEARRLLNFEPAGTPLAADRTLRDVTMDKSDLPTIQKGPGNLASLLPSHSVHAATVALRATPDALINTYNASDVVNALDGVK